MIVGSGGVLSHAPRRAQAALMMMDAYQPEGVTDAGGGLHLHDAAAGACFLRCIREAAAQVFDRDCLIRLGSCIAPVGQARRANPC